MRVRLAIVMLGFIAASCNGSDRQPVVPATPVDPASLVAQGPVRTGARILTDSAFARFKGKRVGLIVNHTAMVDSVHLADLIHRAPGVTLGALFGPEHGLRGAATAGEDVADGRDARTGAPVYSLYGRVNKPTPEMLRGIDVLVFDIQDVGARFYTYISTMGLAMQAAAEAGIPFVVLDRPNPLGGTYVSGFLLEESNRSFVGQYVVPIAHGLTVGELARMIKGEKLLPGLEKLDLEVVRMEGWNRSMRWQETGLAWIDPSPNINDPETVFTYPGTCLFEATAMSEGRGTKEPFRLLGAPWADGEVLARQLNARKLPGVAFEAARFTPVDIPAMATDPKLNGRALGGIRVRVTDYARYLPVETGIYVLDAFLRAAPEAERASVIDRPEFLAKLSGTDRLKKMLDAGATPDVIIAAWKTDVAAFRTRSRPYLLY